MRVHRKQELPTPGVGSSASGGMSAVRAPERSAPATRGIAAPPRDPTPGAGPAPPRLAEGLELIGEFKGSGYKVAPRLVRRGDGQVVQLTPLLYLVAEAIDGRRHVGAIAADVSKRYGRQVTAENVAFLIGRKLRPLGVVALPDGSTPVLAKLNPLLGLTLRRSLVSARGMNAAAGVFRIFFQPTIVVTALVALLAADVWLFGSHGVAPGVRSVLYQTENLLLVFGLFVVSMAYHELGHASACRYGGARPGKMGIGVYVVWPAFYTDVTDAYRLDRRARLRTDLGGVYFNALFALGSIGAFAATGYEPLALLAVFQHVTIVRQLLPTLRFDGYYVISDLTGVPDILQRIGPILRSLVPWRRAEPRASELKLWARVAVTGYLVLIVPYMLIMLAFLVLGAPRILATVVDAAVLHVEAIRTALARGETAAVATEALQVTLPALASIGLVVFLARLGRRFATRVAVWMEVNAQRRAAVALAASVAAFLVIPVWWPNGNYEPIRAGERGTIADGLSSLPRFTSAPSTVAAPLERIDDENAGQAHPGVRRSGDAHEKVGSEEPIHNEGYSSPAPSGSAPAPAPSTTTGATASGTATTTPTTTNRATTNSGTTAGSPAAGGSGTDAGADNQAVAINTKDGESLFSFAFSIRRADGDLVDDRNLAFAYASCKACQTLAVAIQVVLIMSDAHVITPLNQAVAINDECIACETVALAHQYVIGVGAPIDFTADGNARIAEIRRGFLALERSGLPMADTVARAEALAAGVEQVLGTELVPTASAGRSSSEGGGDASDGTTGSAQESTPHVSATPASNDAGTATQGDQPAGEQATTQDQAPAANQRPTVEGATTLPDKPTDGSTVPGPEVGTTGPSGASTAVAGQ